MLKNRIEPPPPDDIGVELSIVLPTHGHGAEAGHSTFAWLDTGKIKFATNWVVINKITFFNIYFTPT